MLFLLLLPFYVTSRLFFSYSHNDTYFTDFSAVIGISEQFSLFLDEEKRRVISVQLFYNDNKRRFESSLEGQRDGFLFFALKDKNRDVFRFYVMRNDGC